MSFATVFIAVLPFHCQNRSVLDGQTSQLHLRKMFSIDYTTLESNRPFNNPAHLTSDFPDTHRRVFLEAENDQVEGQTTTVATVFSTEQSTESNNNNDNNGVRPDIVWLMSFPNR